MLQLQTNNIDICRVTKLISKYNIKSTLTNSTITLDGDISEELIRHLCNEVGIISIQNFTSDIPPINSEIILSTDVEEKEKNEEKVISNPTNISSDQIISNFTKFDKIKRGEVYWCDFGIPYGHEQGGLRPAIIVQNDIGNLHSSTTIVIPCTTSKNKMYNRSFHHSFTFSPKTLIDFDFNKIKPTQNVILVEQIRTIDKSRLTEYIGRIKPEIMPNIEEKINLCLYSKKNNNTKIVFSPPASSEATIKHTNIINQVQQQLLSTVNLDKLCEISQSDSDINVKIENMLKLFGFNLNKNGMEYLAKAIDISLKNTYFTLETLSESVSKKTGVTQKTIERLIVARIKENFNLKKAPTMDFIRLLNTFLTNKEIHHEKNSF